MIVIGHRGAGGLVAENTVASFKKALKCGVDLVEFDVRLSSDGQAVIHHDPAIQDRHGSNFFIADCPYAELKKRSPELAGLDEGIRAIGKNVGMYIELKPGVAIEPVAKVIKKCLADGFKARNFMLASFSQKTLLRAHRELPSLPTIVIERWSGIRARRRASQLGTKFVCMDQRWLWFGFIKAMRDAGYTLYTFTLNNPAKAKRWSKYGLAGVVTDYPDRFKN